MSRSKTVADWHWSITAEQIALVKSNVRSAINEVYFSNKKMFECVAHQYLSKRHISLDFLDDCMQQIYVDLPKFNFKTQSHLYYSLHNCFKKAVSLNQCYCVSLDQQIFNSESENTTTYADVLGYCNTYFENKEHDERLLEILKTQEKFITEKQLDYLVACAYGIVFYKNEAYKGFYRWLNAYCSN